jgi:RNA polymerase sigma-70 factor (ECF subfamily)
MLDSSCAAAPTTCLDASPVAPPAPAAAADPVRLSGPAFARALTEVAPLLRSRAMQLTGSAAAAEDLVQDAIERALRFESQYQRGTNLRAWVHQILFSLFITKYRRARRERVALASLAADPLAWTSPERFAPPESGLSLTPAAETALGELPIGFQRAIRLVDLEERSYREAADELGVPVGTVMSRLHRGRRLLASRLAA